MSTMKQTEKRNERYLHNNRCYGNDDTTNQQKPPP